ncbi:MAG: MBL fold metallo-hydrolase [Clostridiaceae bacterium]|nr:MBL fold metallo-hydrolase [Clostridiaceae bacterium]
MIIECIPNNIVQSNVYIAAQNGEGVVIDCGCTVERLMRVVEKHALEIKYIILTHGHFDHIYYMDPVREKTGAKVCIHELEADYLTDPKLNGVALFPVKGATSFKPADILLKDGDTLECGGLSYKIIHTPGHTKGGICIQLENNLFTGDTLFKGTIGRTDFPGGSVRDIKKSITEKLYNLPDDTTVYPGHGDATTIGYEKRHNPYFRIR